MSSLTDIIFLLLIFFMLTSTLVAPSAIKVLLPSSTSVEPAAQTVNVTASADKKFFVDGDEVQFDDLKAALQTKVISGDENATVVLAADKRLTVETMVSLMSVIKELNVKMMIATNPPS